MEIILHRRNNIDLLNKTPINYGVEIDIRSSHKDLIINHDPFKKGILFKDWIKYYNHGTLILNVKEDGLEKKIIYFIKRYGIKSYFFLDQSFPAIIKNSIEGISNCAVRVSEYESLETALNLEGKVKWVWVDIFNEFTLNYQNYINLKNAKFKLCLVSPEIHKINNMKIKEIKEILEKENLLFDAVCTKFPDQWIKNK